MATKTLTINRRIRSFGYAANNRVENRRGGDCSDMLFVPKPAVPMIEGSARGIVAEHERARRINNGNDWTSQVFIYGMPVVDVVGGYTDHPSREVLEFLRTPEMGPEMDVIVEAPDA